MRNFFVYSVEVQLILFVKHFLFFPPEACCLHFREAIQPRRILYYTGGRQSRPPVPPWTFTTKNVENGAKQISEHSTGCKNMKTKRLGMKAINATHTQARTIITVLDFLLAQNTPPVALWACRRRFFAPRDSARPEIR